MTRHGKPAVVVVDAAEYLRLSQIEQLEAPRFNDHLLAMPTDDGDFQNLRGSLRVTEI